MVQYRAATRTSSPAPASTSCTVGLRNTVRSASGVTSENLAYVIYTSGSTGAPKGSAVPHRSIPGYIDGYARFDATQTWLQHSALAWDALTLELWSALLYGGRCVLLPTRAATPAKLGELIHNHGVTSLWLTAALFNLIVDTAPAALAPVRQLLIGGEALSLPHMRRALVLLPRTQIVNGYGPSECTVFSTCYPIPRALDPGLHALPIGRPVGDREIYVLDMQMRLVPIGVPGELCVGGPALARGYLGRPELTAERFVPNPFLKEGGRMNEASDDSSFIVHRSSFGTRLYKTGDLVRRRAEGVLEFLGRIDGQIKLRGVRIELGEVEAVLAGHSAVRECAVVVREDAPGEKRLIAYVVTSDELQATSTTDLSRVTHNSSLAAELRSFLAERVPASMLPAAFVLLERLPLTSTGKLDRRALPLPERARPSSDDDPARPVDRLQMLLAQIWEEVLDIRPISHTATFFELGGHSLLAVRLKDRIQQLLGRTVPLSLFFQGTTLQDMADVLRQQTNAAPGPLVAIQPYGSKAPLFCVHPGLGEVFSYLPLARLLGSDQPLYGLRAAGLEGKREPFARIEHMAAYYLEAVLRVQPHEGLGPAADTIMPLVSYADLQQLGPDEQLDYLLNLAAQAKLLPPDLGDTHARYLARVLKSNILAVWRYRPRQYPGRITLFRCDDIVNRAIHRDRTLGWEPLSFEAIAIRHMPGAHSDLLKEPAVRALAEELVMAIELTAQIDR